MINDSLNTLTPEQIHDYFHVCKPLPKHLFIRGTFPTSPELVFLTVVGSRNHTPYGKRVCTELISGLRGYPVVIVSGLAHGIDTIAHQAALDVGLITIAFPGSGLDDSVIYPRTNYQLAERIISSGGALISEYSSHQKTAPWIFPMRNRLMAGLSHATLVIEASNQSGSRITAKLATEYNRDVFAVPGNITSIPSQGPNELLKLGALPITSSRDIIHGLGLTLHDDLSATMSTHQNIFIESTIIDELLAFLEVPRTPTEILDQFPITISELNGYLVQLELYGKVHRNGTSFERTI